MSFIIFLFILAVIIALFSFTGQKPQSVPPVFPPVIAPLPEPEYVPVPVEVEQAPPVYPVPVVDPVGVLQVPEDSSPVDCAFVVEVETINGVEIKQSQPSQTPVDDFSDHLKSSYPTLDTVVAEEFKTDETQVSKKKHYYYKPKSKK